MGELQRKGVFKSRVPGAGPPVLPHPTTNLAAMVVEDKPVRGAQEGVAVSAPAQGLCGKRLPQDHMVSHYVQVLEGEGEAQGLQDSRVPGTVRPARCVLVVGWEAHPPPSVAPVPVISPGRCCWPGPPESGWLARRWCRRWQPQSGVPACGARGGCRHQGWAFLPSILTLGEGAPIQDSPLLPPLPAAAPGRGGRQALSPAAAATPAPPAHPLSEAVRPGTEHGSWSVHPCLLA